MKPTIWWLAIQLKREPNPANRASFLIYEGSKESPEEEGDEGLPQAVSAGEVDLVIKGNHPPAQ